MARGQAQRVFIDGLWRNNPIFAQVLGICSTLAVTNKLANTAVMCGGLLFTLVLSNATVSALRRWTPHRVRMMAQVLIIAAYVIIVDIFLKAFLPGVSKQLGPYVGLIITNCIVMGRAEGFANSNPVGLSVIDGLACSLGYSAVLLAIAVFREPMGLGTFFGFPVAPRWWTSWTIMVMAPGAFFMLAAFTWLFRARFAAESQEKPK